MILAVAAQSLPACVSVGDAREIRGAGGAPGCLVAGGCPSCALFVCFTAAVGAVNTGCVAMGGGTDGCALAGTTAVNTTCAAMPAGTGCTRTPAGCGGVMSAAGCPQVAQEPAGVAREAER